MTHSEDMLLEKRLIARITEKHSATVVFKNICFKHLFELMQRQLQIFIFMLYLSSVNVVNHSIHIIIECVCVYDNESLILSNKLACILNPETDFLLAESRNTPLSKCVLQGAVLSNIYTKASKVEEEQP